MCGSLRDTLLGIDWGTSNRRAYLVDRAGNCLRLEADGEGSLAVQGRFASSLEALCARMGVGADVPVLMSGMVGSAGGWQQVDYLDIAVPLDDLPLHVVALAGRARCAIVPGYRTRGAAVDVMRGEECQLLGALAQGVGSGWVVLPGTHAKWVELREGRIQDFRTFMTGELFALLGEKGTLSAMLAPAPWDDEAFAAGLDAALERLPLSHSLFSARARVVTGEMGAAAARAWISGLLIGSEFAAGALSGAAAGLHIVGSSALAERYARAARHFGLEPVTLDPDRVYVSALQRFFDKAS